MFVDIIKQIFENPLFLHAFIEGCIVQSHSENNYLPFLPGLAHLSPLIGWISLISALV